MSAPVFLLNHSTGTPTWIYDRSTAGDKGAPLAEANYQVPILWMALFTDANLTTGVFGAGEDASGKRLTRTGLTLFTTRQDALATYARRKDGIRKKLGPARAQYIDDWERLLGSRFAQETHFQIEFSELCDMSGEAEFEQELRSWINGLDRLGGPGWEALCNQAEIDNPTASPHLGIRGWIPHKELGWEE